MHDIHQAIEVLRDITGQPDLAFGPGENVEVVFDGTPVGFVATGRHHFELVTPLASLAATHDQATLTRLMTANYLGTATGAARLAFDPSRKQVALCERLDLRALDAGGLRKRIADFLGTAAFWNGPAGREAAAGPTTSGPDLSARDHFLIRG